MLKAFEISEVIGAAAIILDVLDDERFDQRMKFYLNLGFAPIDPTGNPKRLFLSIKEIAKTIHD